MSIASTALIGALVQLNPQANQDLNSRSKKEKELKRENERQSEIITELKKQLSKQNTEFSELFISQSPCPVSQTRWSVKTHTVQCLSCQREVYIQIQKKAEAD